LKNFNLSATKTQENDTEEQVLSDRVMW